MRWPFTRSRPEGGAAAEPSAGPQVQRAAAWADLPPIQRSAAAPIELTAETGPFLDHLTGRHPVEPSLQPLGHDVTMEAPAGIATGIASPAGHHHAHEPGLDFRLKSVEPAGRSAPTRAASSPAPAPTPAPAAAASPPAQRAPEASAPETVLEVARAEAPAPAPTPELVPPTPTPRASPAQRAPDPAPAEVQRAPEPPAERPQPAAEPVQAAPVQRAEEPAAAEPALDVQRAPAEEPEAAAAAPAEEAATSPEEESRLARARSQRAPETTAPTVGVEAGRRARRLPLLAAADPAEGPSRRAARVRAAGARRGRRRAGEPGRCSGFRGGAGRRRGRPAPPADPAQRAADEPLAPAAAASSPPAEPTQAAPAQPEPSAPVQRAPSSGTRRMGLGAPIRPDEVAQRAASAPSHDLPPTAPPERPFRRTNSPLEAQRSPAEASLAPVCSRAGCARSCSRGARRARAGRSCRARSRRRRSRWSPAAEEEVAESAQRAPIAGEKAPLAEAGDPLSSVQRAEADAGHDFPPLEVARQPVQRHAGHEDEGEPAGGAASTPRCSAPPRPRRPGPRRAASSRSSRRPALGGDRRARRAGGRRRRRSSSAPSRERSTFRAIRPRRWRRASTCPLRPGARAPARARARATTTSASTAASGGTGPTAAPVQASRFQRAAEAVVRALPLIGKRPLTPVQRADDVPTHVRTQVERHVDADLARLKIHRTPETSSTAKQLSARAYTTGGEVHAPSEQGPLDREPGRSLIAHELVHVAQQRKIGPTSIPREDSSEGRQPRVARAERRAHGRLGPAASARPAAHAVGAARRRHASGRSAQHVDGFRLRGCARPFSARSVSGCEDRLRSGRTDSSSRRPARPRSRRRRGWRRWSTCGSSVGARGRDAARRGPPAENPAGAHGPTSFTANEAAAPPSGHAPPAAHHEDASKLNEEQLQQAYDYFERAGASASGSNAT